MRSNRSSRKDNRMTIRTSNQDQVAALPDGCSLRATQMDDLAAVTALINKHTQVLYGRPDTTEESMGHGWQSPAWNLAQYSRVVTNREGAIVGYCDVNNTRTPQVRPRLFGRVDPDWRGRGIGTALVRWAESALRAEVDLAPPDAKVEMIGFMDTRDQQSIQLLTDEGMMIVRNSWMMVIDLDHPF